MKIFDKRMLWLKIVISIFVAVFISGCNVYDYLELPDTDEGIYEETSGNQESEGLEEKILTEETGSLNKEDLQEEDTLSPEDMTDFDLEEALSYCSTLVCNIDSDKEEIICSFSFNDKVPISDDNYIYLFEILSYEKEYNLAEKKPVAATRKAKEVNIAVEYERERLFSRFVPAIIYEGKFVPLSIEQYITNPEVLAKDLGDYPVLTSKKGILLDSNTLYKSELYDLDVKRVVYNLPLSYVVGETDSEACPTIEYEYDGQIYQFNGYLLAGFDSLFKILSDNGYHTTVIILNDWNEDYLELIHPLSRKKTGKAYYYAFNTEEKKGTKLLEAVASFLADRYTGGEYGMVYDWVIANEINQQGIWNYMDTDDIEYYTESFERSFRIFYNAIKSNYAHANVYFSIDHDWNDNGGNNKRFFNGRDLLYEFNDIASERGNYDWGLSIHPYPSPLIRTKFWHRDYDKSEEAPVVTPMNLSVITDLMRKDEFLDTKGDVRSIGITELGFTSRYSENMQAAAFAYCYYIIDDNEYIDSFLLNRQHDDLGALESGLSLGLFNNDYSPKKIVEVFKNIDSEKGEEYIPEMLKIIGSDSLEEALERARGVE